MKLFLDIFNVIQIRSRHLPVRVCLINVKGMDDKIFRTGEDLGDCACATGPEKFYLKDVKDIPKINGGDGNYE